MAESYINDEGEGKGKYLIVLNAIHLMSDKMMFPWSMPFNHSREIYTNFNRHWLNFFNVFFHTVENCGF